jgi:hypothetical protein
MFRFPLKPNENQTIFIRKSKKMKHFSVRVRFVFVSDSLNRTERGRGRVFPKNPQFRLYTGKIEGFFFYGFGRGFEFFIPFGIRSVKRRFTNWYTDASRGLLPYLIVSYRILSYLIESKSHHITSHRIPAERGNGRVG